MKKSEALAALGLSEGASAEDIKKAHRKLAIENHPDRFGQDAEARAKAEEKMKTINEARDVLESGKWEPEGAPFAYNPYGAGTSSSKNPQADINLDDFFSGFPFGQSTTFVWTTYDSNGNKRTYTSSSQSSSQSGTSANNADGSYRPYGSNDPFASTFGSSPFGSSPFGEANPFASSPFNPFASTKRPEELLSEETSEFKQELCVIAIKVALAILAGVFVSPALGFYLYVIGSIGWALYSNLSLLSSFLIIPFIFLALIFAPGEYSVTGFFGLLAFFLALGWDISDIRKRRQTISALKQQVGL